MTEFKQIIGRGTRINEDYGKFYFTIMDFRGATALFADPDFDGEPVRIYEPKEGEPVVPPDEDRPMEVRETPDPFETEGPGGDGSGTNEQCTGEVGSGSRQRKYYVDDVEVRVGSERVQYLDAQESSSRSPSGITRGRRCALPTHRSAISLRSGTRRRRSKRSSRS